MSILHSLLVTCNFPFLFYIPVSNVVLDRVGSYKHCQHCYLNLKGMTTVNFHIDVTPVSPLCLPLTNQDNDTCLDVI